LRLVAVVTALSLATLGATVPTAASQESCEQWEMRVVADGLDRIENLEPDGIGGMLISAGPRNAIERITPDGQRTTAFSNVPGPGGLRVRGETLFAVTNGNLFDGVTNQPRGKVETFNSQRVTALFTAKV
jgi:hypothetical protein